MKNKICDGWVYRCVYGAHCLINIKDNSILSISPVIGDLLENFSHDGSLLIESWCLKYKVDSGEAEKLISALRAKGVVE